MTDTAVARLAVATVDRTQGVPSDKLLADELEVVHTLRALMAYRPETVRDTLRHVLAVASGALSCEIAVIRIEHDGRAVVEAVGLDAGVRSMIEKGAPLDPIWPGPINEIRLDQAASTPAALGQKIVSSINLPLGSQPSLGVLSLAHAAVNPRGFTSLCQRIGRAIAEAAELLISQAAAREQLSEERDRLATVSRLDALTAIANRRAWDEEVQRLAANRDSHGYLITCDLDELKLINDRHGHAAGDELLRATAALLARLGPSHRSGRANRRRRVRRRARRAPTKPPPGRSGHRIRRSGATLEVGRPSARAAHVGRSRSVHERRSGACPPCG